MIKRAMLTLGSALAIAGSVLASGAWSSAHASDLPSGKVADARAYEWALTKRGDWYEWGGTGPTRFDCSGLVMRAYDSTGVHLPRTTYEMVHSWFLVRVSKPEHGDLAFADSNGHVEFVDRGTRSNLWTYGAHSTGTRIGFVHSDNYFTAFYRVRT